MEGVRIASLDQENVISGSYNATHGRLESIAPDGLIGELFER